MGTRTVVAASHASLAPPSPVASTLETEVGEEVLDGVGDDRDHVTESGHDSDESKPAETAGATIAVGGRVHDIGGRPGGGCLYGAQSDSVVVINGRQHIGARIPVTGPAKNLVMGADGKQLFVINYDGSVVVIDTLDHIAQTLWDGCASDVVVSPDGRHLYAAHNQVIDGEADGAISVIDIACATTVATVPVRDVAALAISPD